MTHKPRFHTTDEYVSVNLDVAEEVLSRHNVQYAWREGAERLSGKALDAHVSILSGARSAMRHLARRNLSDTQRSNVRLKAAMLDRACVNIEPRKDR